MRSARWLVGLALLAGILAEAAAGGLKAGMMATVRRDGAEIRQGQAVVATLKKGQRVKLYWVFGKGGYALIYYKVAGATKAGYIRLTDLEAPTGEEQKGKPACPFVPDDRVVVIAKQAKLKIGDKVLGTLPEGTQLDVKKVKGEWVGVYAPVKGKSVFGWVHARDVDYPSLKDKTKGAPKAPPKPPEGSKTGT